MDDYVSKPLEPDVLLEVLKTLLPGATGATENGKTKIGGLATGSDAASSAPGPLAFDVKTLAERCLGKIDLIERIIVRFEAEASGFLQEVDALVSEADAGGVALFAHKLKGMAANISANELHGIARELERVAKEDNLDAVHELIPALRREMKRCVQDVPEVLARVRGQESCSPHRDKVSNANSRRR
jgi:HPt (histidine-containing phosphotransfer) domain-containing protein